MLSNDIITEITELQDREKQGQSGSNGGRQREKSKFKLAGKNSKSQLARGYFVEEMMNKIYDLVKGQLDSDFSYLAKPGQSPEEDQMTLEDYMTNWYTEYTRGLEIGQKLKSYSNRIFRVMQEQWDDGTYKESLVRDLANATWLATQAPDGMSEPTPPAEPEDQPGQGQLDFEKEPASAGDGEKASVADRVQALSKSAYEKTSDLVGAAQGKSRVTESKTQSAIRAEKIPALKTR
jgi:hypothetical protein